jgi:hypothetical protein
LNMPLKIQEVFWTCKLAEGVCVIWCFEHEICIVCYS